MGAGARDAPPTSLISCPTSHASTPPSALGTHPWLPQKDTEHGTHPLGPFPVPGLHYAWVTLGIAIAMRLVSSVERTASGVLVAYLVDPAGDFGWSRSVVGVALSLQ